MQRRIYLENVRKNQFSESKWITLESKTCACAEAQKPIEHSEETYDWMRKFSGAKLGSKRQRKVPT